MTDEEAIVGAIAAAANKEVGQRRMPLRETATYKRLLDEYLRTGREYHYRVGLLGWKQLGAVACNQPAYVTGPEMELVAASYADAWVAHRRADDELAGLQKQYDYREPRVNEADEIIPEPKGGWS